ncbi:uncharacterized protein TRAVEDRAFT_25727 [Trametes versicolor FP-101664 SS1]|uniref:uncharacterized protein n=1 Tax=Trametes versicolor (strain FP-101664) TaxID=717944 RepID=UPI0004621FE5|nr:uncharacterized protein TRAVEDRAFT_25727 [Trametes versicolor FP-101664 SS1]EIW64594.1 hypothetical protein TRAVEDRAFT_25727 [Trametes versicolor FP-101664 SS1]
MSWLASALLSLIHALYRLVLVFQSVFRPATEPQPITAERSKLPQHLALALVPNPEADDEANEQYLLNSVEKVAGWCQLAGIRRLSVYDREGVLSRSSIELRGRLQPASRKAEPEDSPVECDIQYPLTPPPSDDAESRPLSPHSGNVVPKLGVTTIRLHAESPKPKRRVNALKRRRVPPKGEDSQPAPLTLHILSYQSGKPAVAAAARMFLHNIRQNQPNNPPTSTPPLMPSIQELTAVLEGESGFSSPDLMIVHRKPPLPQLPEPAELGGFPPWQTRLTEIYWDFSAPSRKSWRNTASVDESPSIQETEFRRALDEFAGAEMRLGK